MLKEGGLEPRENLGKENILSRMIKQRRIYLEDKRDKKSIETPKSGLFQGKNYGSHLGRRIRRKGGCWNKS